MNPICYYHRADFDGVCSAAIVKKFVPDCELYGIDYGDPFPWDKVEPLEANGMKSLRRVFMVDFSLKPDEMKRLSEVCDLVWIDHHKSAIEGCAGLDINGIRSTALAGCELAWELFAERAGDHSLPVPESVRLLGRYDVWDAENPDWPRIEAFQFGMRTYDLMNPADIRWRVFLDLSSEVEPGYVQEAIDSGTAILDYRDQEAKSLCADGAFGVELRIPTDRPASCKLETEGYTTIEKQHVRLEAYDPADGACGFGTVLDPADDYDISGPIIRVELADDTWKAVDKFWCVALNSAQRGSWQFNSVYDPSQHDAMVVYCMLKSGKYRVSLYSTKEEVDCGAIAKALGGGGHKGAAGFICDELPWEK